MVIFTVLKIEEGALTGESAPVEKIISPFHDETLPKLKGGNKHV